MEKLVCATAGDRSCLGECSVELGERPSAQEIISEHGCALLTRNAKRSWNKNQNRTNTEQGERRVGHSGQKSGFQKTFIWVIVFFSLKKKKKVICLASWYCCWSSSQFWSCTVSHGVLFLPIAHWQSFPARYMWDVGHAYLLWALEASSSWQLLCENCCCCQCWRERGQGMVRGPACAYWGVGWFLREELGSYFLMHVLLWSQ